MIKAGPTPKPPGEEHPEAEPDEDGQELRWSPYRTPGGRLSWGLLTVFSAFYFVVAVLTSAELAGLAATTILGLPLGFLLGMILIISGLVITRIYLSRGEG